MAYFSTEHTEVLISAIEHFSYCPRQCALIHLEQTFTENKFTVLGSIAHERVERGEEDRHSGVRSMRDVALWSERLGLYGKADVVEFHGDEVVPVEYKVGRPHGPHPRYQLCAQAMCLEEMLGLGVSRGAVFHRRTARRERVEFTDELRGDTEDLIGDIRTMLENARLPMPVNDGRCRNCSLVDDCLPLATADVNRMGGIQGSLYVPLSIPDTDE